jgi:hypothetical protein
MLEEGNPWHNKTSCWVVLFLWHNQIKIISKFLEIYILFLFFNQYIHIVKEYIFNDPLFLLNLIICCDTAKHPVKFNFPSMTQRNIPLNSNYSSNILLLLFSISFTIHCILNLLIFIATCLNRYPNSTATHAVADNSRRGQWSFLKRDPTSKGTPHGIPHG